MKLTKEYALEQSTLTASDFEGLDFEDFVAQLKLTPEKWTEYNPLLLLEVYKEIVNREHTSDYTKIYANAEGTISQDEYNRIKILIWEYHAGNYNDCMVIDQNKGAVYYGVGYFLNTCGESQRVAECCEEDSAFLVQILQNAMIDTWENEYNGTSEGTTGYFSWAVGIQINDGHCFCYSGHGVLNSGTPKILRPMMKALIGHFAS